MLVTAEDGNQYVLKVFSKTDAEQRWYTGAEILGHLLAKQFDINTPDAAILSFNSDHLEFIKQFQPDIYKELNDKTLEKKLFGSKLIQNDFNASGDKTILKFIETYELENLYAFDILINNQDRRKEKPNALIHDRSLFAIDHEKAFEGLEITRKNLLNGCLPHFYKQHLLYPELKRRSKKENVNFETFEENLRYLNVNSLKSELYSITFPSGFKVDIDEWLVHLSEMKNNYRTFAPLLREF